MCAFVSAFIYMRVLVFVFDNGRKNVKNLVSVILYLLRLPKGVDETHLK